MKNILERIDYTNPSEVDDAITEIFYNLNEQGKAVATQRNYKIILSNQMNKALKNNKVPFYQVPEFPRLTGKGIKILVINLKKDKLEKIWRWMGITEDNFMTKQQTTIYLWK